jgi:hypothetical protein
VARTVVAPDGVRWTVRRRWLHAPIRPRWRGSGDAFADASLDLGFDLGDSVLGVIAAIIAIIFLAAVVAFVLLPLAILLVEILIFVVLAVAGLAGRIAFRRPWRLEARSEGGARRAWSVAGWRDSRDALAEIAAALEQGRAPALSAAAWSGAPGSR